MFDWGGGGEGVGMDVKYIIWLFVPYLLSSDHVKSSLKDARTTSQQARHIKTMLL